MNALNLAAGFVVGLLIGRTIIASAAYLHTHRRRTP